MTEPSPARRPRELPDGSHLAYFVLSEVRGKGTPEIAISASLRGNGGGGRWEFSIRESIIGGDRCIRVAIYDEAFLAFTEIPDFFAALHRVHADSVRDVLAVLDALGAVDETTRLGPSAPRRERLKATIVDRLEGCDVVTANRPLIADMVLDLLGETADD